MSRQNEEERIPLHPAGTFPEEHRDDVGGYNVSDFGETEVSSKTCDEASTRARQTPATHVAGTVDGGVAPPQLVATYHPRWSSQGVLRDASRRSPRLVQLPQLFDLEERMRIDYALDVPSYQSVWIGIRSAERIQKPER